MVPLAPVRSRRVRRDQNRLYFPLVALFVFVAFFMRIHRLDSVPPGAHYDEILNGEIAEEALREGPKFFYDHSGGREGMYHLLLAGSFSLPLPVVWQLRLPSILFSFIALLFSLAWVSRAFGKWAGLTAFGLMAASFWTVWMARAALRVGTVTPVAAVAAFVLVSLLEADGSKRRAWVLKSLLLGLVIGLSFYTYRAGSMVFVLYIAFTAYLIVFHRSQVRKLMPSLVVALVVALPIILLFATRPEADPRFGQIALPWQALMEGDPLPALKGLMNNAGMFFWRGDLEGHYNLPGRPHFEPVGALLFTAGVLIAIWRWRQPLYAMCLLWLVVGLLPGVFTLPAPSFVHTVGAQGVTYAFPAITVGVLYRRFAGGWRYGNAFTSVVILLLVVVNGAWTYRDYFIRWPQVDEVRGFHQSDLALIAHDLDEKNQASNVATCSSVLNEADSFWRSGRQSIRFMLNRDDVQIRWYDCGYSQVIPRSSPEARLYFPNGTSFGEWLKMPEPYAVEQHVLAEGVKRITVDSGAWQEALLRELNGTARRPALFGEELAFLGYQLDAPQVVPGGKLTLLTIWQVRVPLPPERSVFVHLLNDAGELVTQGDAFTLLSDTLVPGDVVIQRHELTIPAGTQAGRYPLSVGVYSRLGDIPPLQVTVEGDVLGQRLILQEIEVQAP